MKRAPRGRLSGLLLRAASVREREHFQFWEYKSVLRVCIRLNPR